jgi:hypothetical protein
VADRTAGRDEFPEGWRLGWKELRAATLQRLQILPLRSFGAQVGMTRGGRLLSRKGWRLGWTELRPANLRQPQVPPLRSCGAPVGMTILLARKSFSGRYSTPQAIVIPTGAKRSGGTCVPFGQVNDRPRQSFRASSGSLVAPMRAG